MTSTFYLLKTPPTIDPTKAQDHWCVDDYPSTGLVLKRDSGRLIFASTAGGAYPLGSVHLAVADQTGRSMGTMTVVGTVDLLTGEKRGEVPARKVPFYVFK